MDNLEFEVSDSFAKTMCKRMIPSFSKLKLKKKNSERKNSTVSATSTISQTSAGSDDFLDTFCTASRRGSIWDARIQVAVVRNTMRLGAVHNANRLDHGHEIRTLLNGHIQNTVASVKYFI